MKDLCQYGNRPEDEWEILPWIPDPRPPFKIWVKPEQIAPFFLIPHHPYAISLLLKISDRFRAEEFCRMGLTGSSGDWDRLDRGEKDLRWDCDYCNLQADINNAEVNQVISSEQAWYLREKYLRMERE